MRLLAPEHLAQITDPANWRDNPFAERDARRDSKRKQPAKAFAWLLGTLSVCTVLLLWGLSVLQNRSQGVPWLLGGSFGAALGIVVSGIHGGFVSAAARKHAALMLAQEAQRNTLPGLLTLPLPPFQMLLQAGLYPWKAGMRMALAGLPFYLLAMAAGGLSVWDVLLLYFIFSLLSISFPGWIRPVLTGNTTLLLVAAPTPKTGATVPQSQATQNAAATAAAGQTGGGFGAIFGLSMMSMFLFIPLIAGQAGSLSTWRTYIPDPVLQLMPLSFLSWPLLAARALVTPFDWFGFPVPPLPFVLLSVPLGRYLALTRTAEYLQVGTYRDLASLPTYAPRRRWTGWLRVAHLFVVTGYVWKWAITDGGLGWITPNPMHRVGSTVTMPFAPDLVALTGFAYLLLFSAVLRALFRVSALQAWLRPDKQDREEGEAPSPGSHAAQVVRRFTFRNAATFVVAPFAFAVGYYLACCLMARVWPFPGVVCILAGRMLSIGLSGLLLAYGAGRLMGKIPSGLTLLLVLAACFGPPEAHSLAFLSPTLGLLSLGNPSLLRFLPGLAPPPGLLAVFQQSRWWLWPLVCGGAGVLFLSAGYILTLVGRRKSAATATSPAETTGETILIDPTQVGPEVFLDRLFEQKEAKAKEDTPLGMRAVALLQRVFDNPVAVRELRVRLRGKLSRKMIQGLVILFTVVTTGLLAAPAFSVALGSGLAGLLYGAPPSPAAEAAASALVCWYVVLLWSSIGIGLAMLPAVFAPEREKSTLGFLLLTPMRNSSILFGKVIGIFAGNGVSSGLLILATLLLSALFSPVLGPHGFVVWGAVVVTALAMAFTTGMLSLAVAALFPRSISQGGCGAFLSMILVQGPMQMLIQSGNFLRRRRGRATAVGLAAPIFLRYWLISLTVMLLLSLLFLLLALWGLRRMRKGDIAFEASKQEN